MPVLKWWDFHETSELELLCKVEGLIPITEADLFISEIRGQFITAFGLTRTACAYYEKTIQLEMEKNKLALAPLEVDEMLIAILEKEINDLIPSREDMGNAEIRLIEKYMGFKVDTNLSVWEYYDYKQFIEKDAKQNRGAGQ